jgi:hypothetical protein
MSVACRDAEDGGMAHPPVVLGAAWTALTLALAVAVGYVAVAWVGPEAQRPPAAVSTLSSAWYVAFLLVVPVYVAARRSLLMALPAVAAAAVPQFVVASIGVDRLVADEGLASLVYVVPILMTLGYLLAALVGGTLRAVELARRRQAS